VIAPGNSELYPRIGCIASLEHCNESFQQGNCQQRGRGGQHYGVL
jgi:hypothetical protein